jgi:hypothetical protein
MGSDYMLPIITALSLLAGGASLVLAKPAWQFARGLVTEAIAWQRRRHEKREKLEIVRLQEAARTERRKLEEAGKTERAQLKYAAQMLTTAMEQGVTLTLEVFGEGRGEADSRPPLGVPTTSPGGLGGEHEW